MILLILLLFVILFRWFPCVSGYTILSFLKVKVYHLLSKFHISKFCSDVAYVVLNCLTVNWSKMLIIEILIIFCFALVSNGNSSVKHIMLALGKDYFFIYTDTINDLKSRMVLNFIFSTLKDMFTFSLQIY